MSYILCVLLWRILFEAKRLQGILAHHTELMTPSRNKLQGKVNIHIYTVINRFMTIEDIDDLILLKDRYGIDFIRFIIPRNYGRVNGVFDNEIVRYIESIGRDDIGIKVEKSLSELINVNKISRLAR